MFLILIVLYNKTIATSYTLQGVLKSKELLNAANAKLLLWDNSSVGRDDEDLNELRTSINHFRYVHTSDNYSLTKIYNLTIKNELYGEYKYLILIDDDSKIDNVFFQKAAEVSEAKYDLILPVVVNRGIIRSPMRWGFIKPVIFKQLDPGLLSSKKLMAINSGMIISTAFLKLSHFEYDLRLRNYATDSCFMKFFSKNRKSVYILDYTFEHGLSFFDSDNVEKKIAIFKESKRSNLIIHSDSLVNLIMANIYNLLSSFKNAWKFKTWRFFG